MTTAQVTALRTGLLAFIAIWGTLLFPQLIVQWARFGRLVPRRIVSTAAVLGYACLALSMVFLPVPGPGTRQLAQTIQLVPFQWITDVRTDMTGSGLLSALTTTAFEQMALNVLLFVPLGLFARLLWRRGLIGTTLLGFVCALAIELTQLTANWGTAPFQYRIFDVDDLITNTTGAALGWIAGALFLALRASKAPASAVGAKASRGERIDLTETR
ncbi:VanZ family protein [Amycolatopsis acidicola]|uniref:VanZ family protein n=1 Tax=Amycolatopsis acidicola TaxID=2596893 RepID=A0A5N0V7F6_9PSEU|nr:VanZ family protein [Amycolatopsis acidicola]KAA9161133.1 VanZ family protein [Amycolatopsis acidicola]